MDALPQQQLQSTHSADQTLTAASVLALQTLTTASTIALQTLLHVVRLTYAVPWSRYLSAAISLAALPLRLAWLPFSYFVAFSRVLLSPAVHVGSYLLAWVRGWIGFLASLQPLYTFFGTAAAVGILAGLTLATSSSVITSYLGMCDDNDNLYGTSTHGKKPRQLSTTSKTSESSSNETETDWYYTDPSPRRRRKAPGLSSQTIIEEEDDSEV